MSENLNTVVFDSEVTVPSTEVTVAPRRRGRPADPNVASRRERSAQTATDILTELNGEGITVSELVRRCETRGLVSKTLWTDVYHFLNSGKHNFVSTGGTGTRVKWAVVVPPPTIEELLTLIGVA